jgi:hypothetical protein
MESSNLASAAASCGSADARTQATLVRFTVQGESWDPFFVAAT